MSNSSLSKTQKIIYTLILCIGLSYGAYILFISDIIKEIKNIEAENTELLAELVEIEQYIDNKQVYMRNIRENNDKIASIVDNYYNGIDQKDIIQYFYKTSSEFGLESPSLIYSAPDITKTISYAFDDKHSDLKLENRNINIAYSIEYDKFKDYFNSLYGTDLKLVANSVTISFDESSGRVTGTVSLTSRGIIGSLKKHEDYDTNYINVGVDNIFGGYTINGVRVDNNNEN